MDRIECLDHIMRSYSLCANATLPSYFDKLDMEDLEHRNMVLEENLYKNFNIMLALAFIIVLYATWKIGIWCFAEPKTRTKSIQAKA